MSEPVEHRYSDGVVAEIRSPQAAPRLLVITIEGLHIPCEKT